MKLMLLSNFSAATAAHYTAWWSAIMPTADTPGPTSGPGDYFEGETLEGVKHPIQTLIKTSLYVMGGLAFVTFVAALLLTAMTEKKYGKTMICAFLVTIICLGPAIWISIAQSAGDGLTGK